DDPFPKRERLGVWIIDAKNSHALVDPKQEDAFQFLPQRAPGLGFKIERVDVLIYLGWIFSVLDRPIRSFAKPLGMFANIRMIGRTLKRDVKSKFDPLFVCSADERTKIFHRAQLGMDR